MAGRGRERGAISERKGVGEGESGSLDSPRDGLAVVGATLNFNKLSDIAFRPRRREVRGLPMPSLISYIGNYFDSADGRVTRIGSPARATVSIIWDLS